MAARRRSLSSPVLALLLALAAAEAAAQTLRVATFDTGLSARGPGLLLRDLIEGEEPRIDAAIAMIVQVAPDILVLQDIDWDAGGATLAALADRLDEAGVTYDHRFSLRPNSGMATGLDMDGDGYSGDARDAQGYGRFAGAEGMAVLSRFAVLSDRVVDFSDLLWRDLPGAIPPVIGDAPFPSAEAWEIQRLSSVGHWVVPVAVGGEVLTLLAWSATPPVFDGDEDRNGRRNHDEAALWLRYLDGALASPPPGRSFVLLGSADLDMEDGDGRAQAMRALTERLTDPRPRSQGGAAAADPDHSGDPGLDTADYGDDPGNLRSDYLLVSRDLDVAESGVHWPLPDSDDARAIGPFEDWPRHRIVWADIALPGSTPLP